MERHDIPKDKAMLVDVQYVKEDRKNKLPDTLYLVWKDLETKEKHVTTIESPTVDIYFEKPEYRASHTYPTAYPLDYNLLSKVDKKTVPYTGIIDAIIEDGGDPAKQYAMNCYKTYNYSGLNDLLKYNYVFGADYDIRPLYRYKWMKEYDNSLPKPIDKAFSDIEVDFMNVTGSSDPLTCPVDLITLVDNDKKVCFTFALVGQEREDVPLDKLTSSGVTLELRRRELHLSRLQQEKDLMDHQEELKEELHQMFDDTYGKLTYKFFFYTDEKEMLANYFMLIRKRKYDFVTFWNFEFDVNYLYNRAKVLGLDPNSLFCHPDFKRKECYFKKDRFHFDIKSKTDYFFTTGYTNFVCQMRIYAAIRKSQSELRNFSLNYIGEKVVKDKKLDYGEEGSIKYFSYLNYRKYFIYNIKDVLLQKGIEDHTGDLDNYYATSYQNVTPYQDEFKQTQKLRNVQYMDYLTSGMVPGENQNATPFGQEEEPDDDLDEFFDFDDDEEEETSGSKKKKKGFEGALVGDPRLNAHVGMNLYGKASNNIFIYSIDMDMSSFYPSTIFACNIAPSALHFKVYLDAGQFNVRGGDLKFYGITPVPLLPKEPSAFHDDVAKECIDNYQTHNYLSTGRKWFNLPTMTDLYKECVKKLGA